jgi:hypothetical protein
MCNSVTHQFPCFTDISGLKYSAKKCTVKKLFLKALPTRVLESIFIYIICAEQNRDVCQTSNLFILFKPIRIDRDFYISFYAAG